MTITSIVVPEEWDDNGILLFEEFCALILRPERTVHSWREEGRAVPCWYRFNGNGRLYTTVGDLRRFVERGQ